MIDFLQTKLMAVAIAAVPMGLVASFVYQKMKKLVEAETTLLAKTPKWAHRVYFTMTATALAAAGAAVGIPINCPEAASCLATLDADTIQRVLEVGIGAAVVGVGAHKTKTLIKK